MSPLQKAHKPRNTQKTRKSRLKNGILNYFPGFIKHHFHLKVNLYLIKQSFYSRLINKFKTVRRDVRNGACEVPYIRKTERNNLDQCFKLISIFAKRAKFTKKNLCNK